MPYLSAYPRPGQVALLCEGDVIGYEATLFQKWTAAELGNQPLVDIWSCGTATSILGVSDAIGRSRPIFAIEDRDFRTVDEVRDDCARIRKNREDRGIKIIQWLTWRRCEIENYLLEPNVLLPVFRDVFRCTDDDIINALREILPALGLFQASQYALARARRSWSSTDPAYALLSGLRSRPEWKDDAIALPAHDAFRAGLAKTVETWITKLKEIECSVIDDFDAKYGLWKDCKWEDDFWRIDWAGKEILHWLRMVLSNRFGWPTDAESGQREKLQWTMSREKRDAQDRPIEAALRPRMVDQFLTSLPALPNEVRDELDAIKRAIKAYPI